MKKNLLLFIALTMCCTVKLLSQGTVSTQNITSTILNQSVAYNVYLPPSYSSNTTTKYPVLYLLHGKGGNNTDFTNTSNNANLGGLMNTAIANGAKEFIVIMPNGLDAYYCNTYSSLRYEDFMLQELIPQVEAKYRITATKATRAIAGLSMGGYGATYHAFKYQDMYSSSYSMSGTVLKGENTPDIEALLNSKTAAQLQSLPPYTMECGLSDATSYTQNVDFHNFLISKNIAHTYITRAGIHDWAFWKACLPKVIQFASNNFVISATVPVTGVSVSPTSATVAINGTSQLTATVSPTNATNKAVTWTSGNTAIATVSTTGLVTGKAAGTATITVKTTDQSKTATCAITVTSTTVPVTGVTMSPTSVTIAVNGTSQLTATVAPSNATNKNVTWTSGNTAIATVSTAGLVTGKAAGTATITVTTADGAKTTTCAVTVSGTATTTYYQIQNRWKTTYYLKDGGNGQVTYSTTAPSTTDPLYQWQQVSVGDGSAYVYLKNASTGNYMHIANLNGSVQCGAITLGAYTAEWSKVTASSPWVYLKNRSVTTNWIHIEGLLGYAQYASAQSGWYSAEWQFVNPVTKSATVDNLPSGESTNMVIYPNPVENGYLTINVPTDENGGIVRLYDLQGRNVYESKLTDSQNTFDISSVNQGMYVVMVSTSSGTNTQKLVIK